MNFDIIVVGGGHAGIEAVCAASKMGLSVGFFSMDKYALGRLSCNPAIGGSAKGHLVKEIDALGGVMGEIADRSGIQFRLLNRSKGPAVWASRSQNDRIIYSQIALEVVERHPNITIIEKGVTGIVTEGDRVSGIVASDGSFSSANAVVLCSGTFLNGLMHTGHTQTSGGRFGEKPAIGVTESLTSLGFIAGRLKTGTPPRLNKNTIDWSQLLEQPGDENPQPFSFRTDKSNFPILPQLSCYITYTDPDVHKILEKGFADSPLFTGLIKGVGPRYCPSIEDKIVRFADKTKHQLFLEPEGLDSDLIYLNGFSSSLPADIQYEAVRKLPGLQNVEMVRPGYAVEYDYFPPHQVDSTLETKRIGGLYFAGQVNGTSGYEEAAAQGLVAGINAALKILGRGEFALKRSDAYIGVLIDDLVTKSTDEPYRMFTSRAEHRLLLRQDNAYTRLAHFGFDFGLISQEENNIFDKHKTLFYRGVSFAGSFRLPPATINPLLLEKGSSPVSSSEPLSKLCKRPDVNLVELLAFVDPNDFPEITGIIQTPDLITQIETHLKYEGYIKRQQEAIDKLGKYEDLKIPLDFDYLGLKALSTEGREKLNSVKPRSVGQASRISGVTPSDISILLVYLKR
ncbi:MAG TPA: tRNA uridine-5-carboxymethylaminomethyl(34) synthesis enzyme MnmG [Ignavibacteriaceae bacterium]|nr:tRNA uridine-5-carboxymethylaminomethyl(34) synthesis enzyme MnmG [Ignavibacteriaceae bacterium]